jgi:(1->4)-alpha-D-glucan 1-alpha-D-glucosylmutase
MPKEWGRCVSRWSKINDDFKKGARCTLVPEKNDEYMLYQTLLGAWPSKFTESAERRSFVERMVQYMEKATKESKANTSWIQPNKQYDVAVRHFVRSILSSSNSRFLKDFLPFQAKVSWYGCYNAMSQVLLKLTCPGVPDIYQGNELWDFSLVDPDNRKPVNYAKREDILNDLISMLGSRKRHRIASVFLQGMEHDGGRVKMYITHLALKFRQEHGNLFDKGSYIPLEIVGKEKDHVLSFSRKYGKTECIVAVPRMTFTLLSKRKTKFSIGKRVWQDTRILLPNDPTSYINIFTGETISARCGVKVYLEVADVFRSFPVALLSRA